MHAGRLVADRYELIRPLGRGSFGHTWLARKIPSASIDSDGSHPSPGDAHVAIKIFRPRDATDFKAFELFEREAATLRSLRHPGIPAFRDFVTQAIDGEPVRFLVMEYIDGESLQHRIDAGSRAISSPSQRRCCICSPDVHRASS